MSDEMNLDTAILSKIRGALDRLSESDREKLGDPAFEMQIKLSRRRIASSRKTSEIPLDVVATKLSTFDSRDEAQSYLKSVAKTKKDLEQIARHFEMVISKRDKIENLVDRIVETTVGARLRSRAIQGAVGREKSVGDQKRLKA